MQFEYIEPKSSVVIHGLQGRPDLNASRAVVVEYAAARARYRVRVDGTNEEVYLKPDNVRKVKDEDKMKEEEVVVAVSAAGAAVGAAAPTATATAEERRGKDASDNGRGLATAASTSEAGGVDGGNDIALEEIVLNPDAEAEPIEEIKDTETLLKEFFKDVSDATRDAEVERILSSFKLNPYEFLNVKFDCELKEIPRAFRKASLLVHPDKCKHKDAKAAFDALGQAQKLLLEEDFKRAIDFNLTQAKESVLTTWRKEARDDAVLRLKYQGNKEGMLEDFMKTDEFHERWKFEARKYIVDLEWRRRKLALRIKDEEKRITEEEKKELAERKREHKERREWESEDRREKRVGGWRDFMKDNKVKKAKFSVPLKTEVKEKDKKAFALERERIQRPDEVTKAFQ